MCIIYVYTVHVRTFIYMCHNFWGSTTEVLHTYMYMYVYSWRLRVQQWLKWLQVCTCMCMCTVCLVSPVSEAIKLLLRHIGIESCRLVPGFEIGNTVSHNLPLVFLGQCCDLLDSSVREREWGNSQAIIITLLVSWWAGGGGREGGREGKSFDCLCIDVFTCIFKQHMHLYIYIYYSYM